MAHWFTKHWAWWIIRPSIAEISGLQNLPKRGPFLLATNHESYIDPPLLVLLVARELSRDLRMVAMRPLFRNSLYRWFYQSWWKSIPVNGAVEEALRALHNGGAVGIFPEGGRTNDGTIKRVKKSGTAVLALLGKEPVIPVGIRTFKYWPRQHLLPNFRKTITVNIGKSVHYNGKPTRQKIKQVTRDIMKRIAELAGQKYKY